MQCTPQYTPLVKCCILPRRHTHTYRLPTLPGPLLLQALEERDKVGIPVHAGRDDRRRDPSRHDDRRRDDNDRRRDDDWPRRQGQFS